MKKLIALFFAAFVAFGVTRADDGAESEKPDYVYQLKDANFEQVFSNTNNPIVIDFSATWCGPCRIFAPTYHEVADEMHDKAQFFQVDVDESPTLAKLFQVQALPTIMIINPVNGKADKIEGVVSKEELVKRIKVVI